MIEKTWGLDAALGDAVHKANSKEHLTGTNQSFSGISEIVSF